MSAPFASRGLSFIATVLFFVFIAQPVEAVSRSCGALAGQLASYSGSAGRSTASASSLKSAIRKQKRHLARLSSDMASRGCRERRFLFQRSNDPQCPNLRSLRKRMLENLTKLERRLRRENGSAADASRASKRLQIRRKMRRLGCDTRVRSEQLRTAAISRADRKKRVVSKRSANALRRFDGPLSRAPKNLVRTLCVRTCDGFFFPVSHSTTPDRIATDAGACSNLCPGAPTALFFHRTGDQTTGDMIAAADGKPYADQPFAFVYRDKLNPSCSCRAKQSTGTAQFNAAIEPGRMIRRRGSRLPSFRSREVVRAESFSIAFRDTIVPPIALPPAPKVRIVGEAFFPVR